MLATRPSTLVSTSSGLPQAVDAFVGSALELFIHSVEIMRERLGRFAMRAALPRIDREG
ncbi:MAG TPA: hypothetical protein VFP84_21330 [Kofleriaceae bacterium]|nr:hypothetical protein [Kofleriaceae bacterium]